MASKTKVGKTVKVRTPLFNNVSEVIKGLRTQPKLAKALNRPLPIIDVFEVDSHGTRCVVVYVKSYVLRAMKKSVALMRAECEKKLGKQVYFVGYRRIIPKPIKRSAMAKVHRPYRRTVTGVHQSILEDLVFPSEIMGKRTIYRADTGKLTKVFLDIKTKGEMEKRLKPISDVYKRLTRREFKFEFPLYDCPMRMLDTAGKKQD